MQFSIRWALAATAYVALASASLTYGLPVLRDMLWAVTLIALVYSIVATYYGRCERQARALGFLVAFLICLTYNAFGGWHTPATRLVAGVEWSQGIRPGTNPVDGITSEQRLRAANAISPVVAGLVGLVLGVVAYRRRGK